MDTSQKTSTESVLNINSLMPPRSLRPQILINESSHYRYGQRCPNSAHFPGHVQS